MESPFRGGTVSLLQNGIKSDSTTCNVCNKSFKTRFALTQHSKIHCIEKLYACLSCNKRFATKGCLEIHELSHSGDICKLCGNSFSQPSGSSNPKNLCDTCSGYSNSPETTSRDLQMSSTEEESFTGQLGPDSSERRQRRVYISEHQKRRLVQFMEDHTDLVQNQLSPRFTPRDRKRLWEELKLVVNNVGDGRIKSVAQWKKCWNDLKSNVKERATKLKTERGLSGNCPLSDIDERIFTLSRIAASRDQVRIREPSKRQGLRSLSVRVEVPKLQASEDFDFSTEEVTSMSPSEIEMKLEESNVHEYDSPDYEVESPKGSEIDAVNNDRNKEIASPSVDPAVPGNLPDISPNISTFTNPNGLRNKNRKVLLPMTELKEAKAAVISMAETNKETLDAFKRIATAQERLLALQAKRNEEQRQFENKLLLMVEGLLTNIQKK